MSSVDKVLAKKETEACEREQGLKKRHEKNQKERLAQEEFVTLVSSCSTSDGEGDTSQGVIVCDDGLCTSGPQPPKRARRGTRNLLDEKLAISLDVTKVSDRNAGVVLIPSLQSLHVGLD